MQPFFAQPGGTGYDLCALPAHYRLVSGQPAAPAREGFKGGLLFCKLPESITYAGPINSHSAGTVGGGHMFIPGFCRSS